MKRIKKLKIQNPNEYNSRESKQKRLEIFRKFESKALSNNTALRVITELSVSADQMFDSCKYYPLTIRNANHSHETSLFRVEDCLSIKPLVPSVYEAHKCFTLFSELTDQIHHYKRHNRTDSDLFWKQMNNSDYNFQVKVICIFLFFSIKTSILF